MCLVRVRLMPKDSKTPPPRQAKDFVHPVKSIEKEALVQYPPVSFTNHYFPSGIPLGHEPSVSDRERHVASASTGGLWAEGEYRKRIPSRLRMLLEDRDYSDSTIDFHHPDSARTSSIPVFQPCLSEESVHWDDS
jgi:hypothetical protein